MGNPEEALKPYEGGNKIFWLGLRLAHGLQFHPALSGVSRLAHSGWVWHVRRLES